jgi:hypothetical protein
VQAQDAGGKTRANAAAGTRRAAITLSRQALEGARARRGGGPPGPAFDQMVEPVDGVVEPGTPREGLRARKSAGSPGRRDTWSNRGDAGARFALRLVDGAVRC